MAETVGTSGPSSVSSIPHRPSSEHRSNPIREGVDCGGNIWYWVCVLCFRYRLETRQDQICFENGPWATMVFYSFYPFYSFYLF